MGLGAQGQNANSGNRGSSWRYEYDVLRALSTIATNTASGADNELVNTDYIAIANGVGYSIGDSASRTLVLSVPGGNVVATLWWNNSTGLQIVPNPPYADFDQVSTSTSVTVVNGAGVLAVNVQDGGNSLTVDLATTARVPSAVSAVANGSTTAGVRSVTLWFRGDNGSVGGVTIPNNGIITYKADAQGDTLNSIAYVVPTTLEARIIITYTT